MLSTNLVADLLAQQDEKARHTLLTRLLISGIILFANIVYAGFFGVIGVVIFYLLGIELMELNERWLLAPLGLALIFGLWQSTRMLKDYWTHHGHG